MTPETRSPASRPVGGSARRIDRTIKWFSVLLILVLGGMFARVVQLQAAPPKDLTQHTVARTATQIEPAKRGEVLDREGRVLASSRFGMRVFIDPTRFPQPPEFDLSVMALADAMGVRPEIIGPKILEKMVENQRRLDEAGIVPKPKVEVSAKKKKVSLSEAVDRFQQRLEGAADDTEDPVLVRYLSLGQPLSDAAFDAVKKAKIAGVYLEPRSIREVTADDYMDSLLGRVGTDDEGLMGAERSMNKALAPKAGRFQYVRDSRGNALWVEPGGYTPPRRGSDVRLSIDLELQRIAIEELDRGVHDADAAGGRLIIMDPRTGEILAMVDLVRDDVSVVDYDWKTVIAKDNALHGVRYRTITRSAVTDEGTPLTRNRCVEDVYEPGSTFKPFMWSAVTELGLARPGEIFDTHNGVWETPYGRALSDVAKLPRQSWCDVLVNSSNIGMQQGTARMSFQQMRDAVVKFGFGRRTGVGLPGESPGLLTSKKDWSQWTQTSVAMGHAVSVTPLQMVRAFSTFARDGDLIGTLPQVHLAAKTEYDDTSDDQITKRVLPADVAALCRTTMRGVTLSLDRKLADQPVPEKGWKYELFGKSGTAEIALGKPPKGKSRVKGSDGYFSGQYNSSFIAGGPVKHPRLVMIVVIDDPAPEKVRARHHYGAKVAGPVVRRVMERALEYLGVEPEPPDLHARELVPHVE